MGLPVSPIVANLFMEHFEQLALSSAAIAPSFCGQCMNDTFIKISSNQMEAFTQYINSVYPVINFTMDWAEDGKLLMPPLSLSDKSLAHAKISVSEVEHLYC